MFLAEIENKIFQNPKVFSIEDIICEYIDELDADDARNKLYALKHLTNLYKGTRLSKKWRKYLYNLINSNEPIYNLKNFYIENYHEEKKETIC